MHVSRGIASALYIRTAITCTQKRTRYRTLKTDGTPGFKYTTTLHNSRASCTPRFIDRHEITGRHIPFASIGKLLHNRVCTLITFLPLASVGAMMLILPYLPTLSRFNRTLCKVGQRLLSLQVGAISEFHHLFL